MAKYFHPSNFEDGDKHYLLVGRGNISSSSSDWYRSYRFIYFYALNSSVVKRRGIDKESTAHVKKFTNQTWCDC